MPYEIKKVNGGYKVFSPKSAKSGQALTLRKAKAQLRAIYANTGGK